MAKVPLCLTLETKRKRWDAPGFVREKFTKVMQGMNAVLQPAFGTFLLLYDFHPAAMVMMYIFMRVRRATPMVEAHGGGELMSYALKSPSASLYFLVRWVCPCSACPRSPFLRSDCPLSSCTRSA